MSFCFIVLTWWLACFGKTSEKASNPEFIIWVQFFSHHRVKLFQFFVLLLFGHFPYFTFQLWIIQILYFLLIFLLILFPFFFFFYANVVEQGLDIVVGSTNDDRNFTSLSDIVNTFLRLHKVFVSIVADFIQLQVIQHMVWNLVDLLFCGLCCQYVCVLIELFGITVDDLASKNFRQLKTKSGFSDSSGSNDKDGKGNFFYHVNNIIKQGLYFNLNKQQMSLKKKLNLQLNLGEEQVVSSYENYVLSPKSDESERQKLFKRAQKQLIENRLKKNVTSLSNLNKSLRMSRMSRMSSSRGSTKKVDFITRTRSLNCLHLENSRAQILSNIVDKLKPSDDERSRKLSNSRISKLNSMLRDIKKCNQETKVVHTIKRQKDFYGRKKQKQGNAQLAMLMEQLSNLRSQLKQVKQKNNELLINMERSRAEHSRMNSFNSNIQNSRKNLFSNGIVINGRQISDNSRIQYSNKKYPCFACGCTCQSQRQF